jgi:hypothetical protein
MAAWLDEITGLCAIFPAELSFSSSVQKHLYNKLADLEIEDGEEEDGTVHPALAAALPENWGISFAIALNEEDGVPAFTLHCAIGAG